MCTCACVCVCVRVDSHMCVCLYQIGGVGCCDGAVGLDESGLELCHLVHGGHPNSIVLLHRLRLT